MSETEHEAGATPSEEGEAHAPTAVSGVEVPEGLEGYPYATPQAERRIKSITSVMSVVTCVALVAGLYLMLNTTSVALGGVLTLVGFFGLMVVPGVAKRMRRAAIEREGQGL